MFFNIELTKGMIPAEPKAKIDQREGWNFRTSLQPKRR
jgi:hypothetical protein